MGLIDDRKVRRLLTEDDLEAIAEEDHEFLNSKGVFNLDKFTCW